MLIHAELEVLIELHTAIAPAHPCLVHVDNAGFTLQVHDSVTIAVDVNALGARLTESVGNASKQEDTQEA
jgi:hypothetical protein